MKHRSNSGLAIIIEKMENHDSPYSPFCAVRGRDRPILKMLEQVIRPIIRGDFIFPSINLLASSRRW
jgi:hypothetical protein